MPTTDNTSLHSFLKDLINLCSRTFLNGLTGLNPPSNFAALYLVHGHSDRRGKEKTNGPGS